MPSEQQPNPDLKAETIAVACPAKPGWGPTHQHQANTNPALLAARTGNSCLVQAARERGGRGIVGQIHNGDTILQVNQPKPLGWVESGEEGWPGIAI